MTQYSDLLKHWRKQRRMSQLGLAVEAGVSARHISFLETGRSRPSPDMIAHVSEVLNVPVNARNQMMRATGFVPRYAATPLDDVAMAPIREAVSWTLDRHTPYPGLVLDRLWKVIQLNVPAAKLFAPLGVHEGESLLDLVTNPMMPDLVENWPEVAHHTMLRLRAESAAAGGIPALETAIQSLSKHAQILSDTSTGPTVPTVYRFGDQRLSLFGTIAQFSSVNDETLDDLRLELFFPDDQESANWLASFQ